MSSRIAVIPDRNRTGATERAYLDALRARGFRGEMARGQASRTVFATDNSIYQRAPQAVIFPLDAADVALALKVAGEAAHRGVVFAARGGGTGTNGQSLTDGIVIDLSRHMTSILEINVAERWARVQAGVVKDQLNAALKPHGLFFAPELSTSNRATIGGMVNTDASGQGSCTYGKTRDHVLELRTAFLGGDVVTSTPIGRADIHERGLPDGRHRELADALIKIAEDNRALIDTVFPNLNRCLTGYDIKHMLRPDGVFDLNSLLCGSEGTLGVVLEVKLNLLPIPKHSTLVNVRYDSFMSALRDARHLISHQPLSIETVDSRVLERAMQDVTWHDVAAFFPSDPASPTLGINIVEFSGEDPEDVAARVAAFACAISEVGEGRLGFTLAEGKEAVSAVYAMRKRAVGLLGNVTGEARPQPFVEDAAVPPEKLADFIAAFRALLDGYGLQYGMFGHVDAGVLHVRPLLDLRQPQDRALIKPVSDGVAALAKEHGGLLWGEHGKGLRSAYVPTFFGPLYPALQRVKALFDPYNQLNPGKIATSVTGSEAQLTQLLDVPLRGDQDRTIEPGVWKSFGAAMHCNGNGACYNIDVDDPMCPSWKGTRDRRYSPKGRAQLMKAWLRLQADAGVDIARLERQSGWQVLKSWLNREKREGDDFSHEVYHAMSTCLSCKSCTSQCPVHVDVPELRARFLALYHARFRRPVKDYLLAGLEPVLLVCSKAPRLFNMLTGRHVIASSVRRFFGLVDLPRLSTRHLSRACREMGINIATPEKLKCLDRDACARHVIFVADVFTRSIAPAALLDAMRTARHLGYEVHLSKPVITGKPLHVYGFLRLFNLIARRTAKQLRQLSESGATLVGIDPALTLVFRQEYRSVPRVGALPKVEMLQEWLSQAVSERPFCARSQMPDTVPHKLLLHCTEKTSLSDAPAQWESIFQHFGLKLERVSTGCCGMSGAFGHEAENADLSREIFELSWGKVSDSESSQNLVATGFSCQSQVKRFRDRQLSHPISVIASHLEPETAARDQKSVFQSP